MIDLSCSLVATALCYSVSSLENRMLKNEVFMLKLSYLEEETFLTETTLVYCIAGLFRDGKILF